MSAYIYFYARYDSNLVPLASFSRNSRVYDWFRDLMPYEEIYGLEDEDFATVLRCADKEIKENLDGIQLCKDMIEDIKGFNNSTDEKLQAIHEYTDEIMERTEFLEELREARSFVKFLVDARDPLRYNEIGRGKADGTDEFTYIYCGIETGFNPTL